jgi:hypothetical protein
MAIEVISVSNPVYVSNNAIDCDVVLSHMPGTTIRYTASASDVTDHGKAIWQKLNAGEGGTVKPEVVKVVKITEADIDAYRDQIIDSGIVLFGKPFQTRPQDRENIGGASTLAISAMMAGKEVDDPYWHGGTEPFTWICADNTTTVLAAYQVLQLGKAIAIWKQRCIFTARQLKDFLATGQDVSYYKERAVWPSNVFEDI